MRGEHGLILCVHLHVYDGIVSRKNTEVTLLAGCDVFITLRVSEPVYITTPRAFPDAITLLAQMALSRFSDVLSSTSSV